MTRTIPKGKGNRAAQGTSSTVVLGGPRTARNGGQNRKNPGGNQFSQSRGKPIVEGTTSAWIRTLFDPAHARDFGCVGLPDENQTPTSVLSHRYDLVINRKTFVNTSVLSGIKLGKIASGALVLIDVSASTSVTTGTVTKIYLMNHPDVGLLIAAEGEWTVENTPYTHMWGYVSEIQTFLQGVVVNAQTTARALSSSVTVDNVTAWANTGGYFTGGNFPYNLEVETNDDIIYLPANIDQFATFTGESAAGAYAIARPRSLDQIKLFKGLEQYTVMTKVGNATPRKTIAISGLAGYHPAWDWSYVAYMPCDTDSWTLRMTWFGNYEVTRPYSEGGQDGAVFDKASLELAVAMCDNMSFVYPAEYNDLGLLLPLVKKMAGAAIGKITAGMGLPPTMAKDVQHLVDALLNRKAARKQLASYAVM